MHNSVSKGASLSAGGRRQRTRKLSKPQKRQQNIDSREGEQHTGNGQRGESCFVQHKLKPNPDVASTDVGLCETIDGSRCVGSERGLGDTEDRTDGIKKEPINEFIVDTWYDLGPCPYTHAYSPGGPESTSTEKLEIKDTTADSWTETSLQNERAQSSKPTLETTTPNRASPTRTFDSVKGMKIPHSTHVYPSTDRGDVSESTGAAQGKEPYKAIDVAGPNGSAPISVLQPFFGCPLPNNGNSFILQANNFPLSVHAATPYIHMAPTHDPLASNSANSHTSLAPRHNHYYMTNLSMMKPDVTYSHIRPEAGVSSLNSCSQNYSVCNNTDQFLTTTSIMPCAIGLPSIPSISVPLRSPAVGAHYFAPRLTSCERPLQSRELLHANTVYRSNSCHSSGVVLVPSHPYYVQQMPFVPLIPAVSCNSLHVDVPGCCPNVDAGTHGLGLRLQEAGRHLKTPTGSSAPILLRTADPMATSPTPVESDKPCWTEKQAPCTVAPSQHSARIKVKPKMASSTDFIDPTRIKFGIDDVDTDDDVSNLNDFSDCSDKEWHPNNRDLKTSCRRDGESGNRWASKEDGLIESDGSVKKMCPRRRQRSSKEIAECHECGKVFKGSYYLRRHHMSHSDVRPFQCSTCHKCFKQKAHLIGHQSVHERARKLQVFDDKPATPKSKPLVPGSKCPGRPKKAYTEKERACKECGKVFKTVYRLKRHELSHTDVRPFSCRICGKAFKQTGHRNEHEANHEKTKRRFLCNMCGVVFRCRSSFNNHMRSHGLEKLRLQTARSDVDGPCGENKAENNEVCHTGYDCPYCTEKFATAQALNSHLESHVEVQQRRHVQPYSCDVCRRAFTYRHNLIKHKLSHKAPDRFAQFYKEKFEAHLASGKPSFKCTKCAKVFIRKETLAKHCKIHTGSKPFKCAICSHEFTQNVHLKVHMRKHTGSRPFQCKECNKSFIDSTALAKHIEYEACNTDNCLYRCKLCDKMHYYLGSLKKHIRKRHGAKEEDMENHILKSERSLKRKGASQEDKHSCKVCSSSFSEKCNLVRHIKRKHSILVELLQKEMDTNHAKGVVNKCSTGDAFTKEMDTNHAKGVVNKCSTGDALTKEMDTNHAKGVVNKCSTGDALTKEMDTNHAKSVVNKCSTGDAFTKEMDTNHAKGVVNKCSTGDAFTKERGWSNDTDRKLHPWLLCHFPASDVTASCEAHVNSRDVPATCEPHVKSRFCKEFANTLHAAASCELKAERDGSPISSEGHEISSPVLTSTVKTEPVNSPPRPSSTWGGTDHTIDAHNPSAEHHEAKCFLKHKLEEENTGECVKGFLSRDFVFGQKQQGDICAHKSLCKSPCCSHERSNISSPPGKVNVQQKAFGMFANKGSTDEESSSPTDIHFLYKIGLVVSSKGKVPGTPMIKENWNSRDNEYKYSPFMSVSKSLTRLGISSVGSDDPKSRREHDSKEDQQKTPKPAPNKSGSFSFLDDACSDRGDAGTSTDDSCSAGCGGEPKQGFSSSPSEGSGDEMTTSGALYRIRQSLEVGEHICTDTEHCPSEVEHEASQVEGRGLVVHLPCEAEYHSSQVEHRGLVEHQPNEVKHHPSKAEHHPGKAEHHPGKAEHHAGKAEHHPCLLELSPLKCKHNFPNNCSNDTLDSDKQFTEHSTAECDNQVRIHPDDGDKMHMWNTAAPTRLDAGDPASLVADRCGWSKLHTQGAHPQLRHALARACLAANKVCPLSIYRTTISLAAQPCTRQQQEHEDHTRLLNVKQCAVPAEPVGTTSGVSDSLQRDTGTDQMCTISRDFGKNAKTSCLLGPDDGMTSVETMTSDSRHVLPGVIKTRQSPISLSDRTVEAPWNDANYGEHITIEGDSLTLTRTPMNCCSLTSMPAKEKTPDSFEQSLLDHFPNPAAPNIHSNRFLRRFSSRMSTMDSSKNDYEACPTESHVKYLGLLACKDAQEVKNKRTPIENLYQKYKPWLEELVRNARPRRSSRFRDKWRTAARTAKTSGSATTVAEQLTYLRRISPQSTDNNRTISVCAKAASSMKTIDPQQTVVSEASTSKRECPGQKKHLEEISTGPETSKEQSVQTLSSGSHDSEALPPSANTPRSISATGQQPESTPAISSPANSCKEANPCTLPATATVSADGNGPVSLCAGSLSPSSTPESAVTGKQVYVCLVCHKYFTARHQLKRHAMTHTDHRPYTCDKCGRAFRQKVHLSDHVKRHQGQRPFVCAGCGKRFVLKNEMNQHIKNHCRGGLDAFKSVSVVRYRKFSVRNGIITDSQASCDNDPSFDHKEKNVRVPDDSHLVGCLYKQRPRIRHNYDKRAFHTVMKDSTPLPDATAGESLTQPRLQSPDCVLKLGQCYRAGDTISNGTITLKVIESAHKQAHEKPDSCVSSSIESAHKQVHEKPDSCVSSSIESAHKQVHEKPDSCVSFTSITPAPAAPAATASSPTTDPCTPSNGSRRDPLQRLPEASGQGDKPGQ